jgi:hypothetical protein
LSESSGVLPEKDSGYTIVGVLEDGTGLNRAVSDLRELGITGKDLTVVLKRTDPDVPEPFPEGTRYIVVPDDLRGLEIPIGFAAIFVVASLLFAFTAPGIGTMVFVFFSVMAAILAAGAFTSVGVDPILMEMQAPPEDAGAWNDAFERGKVLLFAHLGGPAKARGRLLRNRAAPGAQAHERGHAASGGRGEPGTRRGRAGA